MSKLRVFPNPWAAFDKHGRPCGVCPRDPEADGGGPGKFVGARVDRKRTVKLQDFGDKAEHELRSEMQSTAYEYLGHASDDPELALKLLTSDPVELPVSKYYKQRIADGSLIPADEETAALARRKFVPLDQFVARHAPAPSAPATETSASEAQL